MEYYERIKALREDSDINQTELGQALNVGQKAISQYENGQRKPSPETIIALAKFFKVSTDYLLCLTDEK